MQPRHCLGLRLAIEIAITLWTTRIMAITAGEPDGNRHPNVGVIIYYDPDLVSPVSQLIGPGPYFQGSGTLIHERVFLTAGHVVVSLQSFIEAGVVSEAQLYVSFNEDPFAAEDYRSIVNMLS